ncbi:twin-arginine translocase TatA/TatE family subunit [Demequina sp. NBRC 110055]|uniref:twin-arginine translocase TatA/TatE family subunit n=1 Tax=Demequina sp. NBRC 110055 TaxID=1570344 RepID=UPI000A06AEAA|nr:twin-arginine translocase TatA/TatE family subunit [Demequina sp. NBRC 110055]
MFGINGGELLVIILVAILVVGPERMPSYAKQLRDWVVRGRDYVNQGKDQLKNDVGGDVDWSQYDPRQYDPRRIVREALAEPAQAPRATSGAAAGGTGAATPAAANPATASAPGTPEGDVTLNGAPYDTEAT